MRGTSDQGETFSRMVHPILLLAPFLHHINGWAVYFALKSYGFPRIYRRLVRASSCCFPMYPIPHHRSLLCTNRVDGGEPKAGLESKAAYRSTSSVSGMLISVAS